ncbi:MAG: YMGG-like glycine zipper-containing protein [Alphaproteobacteria bacterium]
MKISSAPLVIAVLALAALAACGRSPGDRALSGAGIGAGSGVVGAALVGGNPGTGAVVGAAAGAAIGAVSNPDKFNLGKPWWK